MQISSSGKTFQLFVRPAHRSGNLKCVTADTLGMSCRFIVAEIDCRTKCLQCVFITALDLLEGALQLPGALRDHFFKALTVVFDLSFELPLVQCALEACQDRAFPQGFNEIVVRTAPHRSHTHVDIIHTSGDQKRHMRMESAYFGEELHTTDARHMEVGNDRIELLVLQSRQSFLATAGSGALESGRAQDEGEKLASSRFIVDGKNACSRLVIRWNLRERAFRLRGKNLVSFMHNNVYRTFYWSTHGPVFSMKRHP